MADHIWEVGTEGLKSSEINPGDLIFCQSDMLEALCERVLTCTSIPVTLLLGNSDRNHTQLLGQLLANTGAVKTFAQNIVDRSGLPQDWEAMYLGCVPIVLRSHITQSYEALGLPVWLVDSFD